jgi:hypothetical protein
MTDVVIPDVAEAQLAFRCWQVADDDMLWSITAYPKWQKGRTGYKNKAVAHLLETPVGRWDTAMVATCKRDGPVGSGKKEREHGRVPDPDCTCGLYAATDLDVVAGYVTDHDGLPVAVGLVQGYGRLIPAEYGWRAEKARIACLFSVVEDFTVAHRRLVNAARRYGVPLVRPWSDDANEYAAAVREGTLLELDEAS